jgi:hypothetical protein
VPPDSCRWFRDRRGNPSRWVALGLAALFGVGAVAAALLGEGDHVAGVLGMMFVVAFNVAFGRRGTVAQIAAAVVRRSPKRGVEGGPRLRGVPVERWFDLRTFAPLRQGKGSCVPKGSGQSPERGGHPSPDDC